MQFYKVSGVELFYFIPEYRSYIEQGCEKPYRFWRSWTTIWTSNTQVILSLEYHCNYLFGYWWFLALINSWRSESILLIFVFLANNGSWNIYQVDIQCILKEFILFQRQDRFSVIITLWKSKQSTVSLLSSSCIVDFCELTVFLLFWLFYCVSNDKRMTSIKCRSTNLELTVANYLLNQALTGWGILSLPNITPQPGIT